MSWFGLFSSVGTLVCCALPSLLVFFGLGATVASALSAAPWLVTLSRLKAWVFLASGLLLALTAWVIHVAVPRLLVTQGTCPADDPAACARVTHTAHRVFLLSVTLWAAGFALAFLFPLLLPPLAP